MTTPRRELDALLVKRALEGLDDEEARRLDLLFESEADIDPDWVDRLVGELDAASVPADAAAVSAAVRDAVLSGSPAAWGPEGASTASEPRRRAPSSAPTGSSTPGSPPRRWRAWGGWVAAAAVAALWIGTSSDPTPSTPAFTALAAAPDAIVAEWAPGPDPTGADVRGEVVWSTGSQAGVMRLEGLEVNVPSEYQYQLWIFDRDRDERYPVDGGVFDMPPGGEPAEVPIQAKLAVAEPTLFAVTVEPPGGVVVSSRERIATVAEVTD